MPDSQPSDIDPTLPASPPCPFCDLRDTELVSPFGGQLSVATFWCNRCRTGFDYIKWEDAADRAARE